jgi:pimeloyl-ACP methyl ester carboxylesterase
MSGVVERFVEVNHHRCRIWEKGRGETVGFLPGLGGAPRWTPFLDRLAERRRVVVVSPPGYPGSERHELLDERLDWAVALLDLLEAAGLDGTDLIGASVGGSLAAEAAAIGRGLVRRLVLIAPFGFFDEREPTADVWAQKPRELAGLLLQAHPERFHDIFDSDDDANAADAMDWQIQQVRAMESAARWLWPLGDTRIAKRLHRIKQPTLLLWGSADRVIPASYAKRFEQGIAGPVTVRTIAQSGHLAEIDQPDAVADAVLEFLASALER